VVTTDVHVSNSGNRAADWNRGFPDIVLIVLMVLTKLLIGDEITKLTIYVKFFQIRIKNHVNGG
jgi:rRNA pseudouridine-1189 N-methylase Emg1 (Nep1/Mra1 family)